MGLLVTLTELLGRLTILTPLLERYVSSNRATAGAQSLDHMEKTVTQLRSAHEETSASLQSGVKDLQERQARIEETLAGIANRLTEMAREGERADEELKKVKGWLRLVLGVGLVVMVAVLVAVGLVLFRMR